MRLALAFIILIVAGARTCRAITDDGCTVRVADGAVTVLGTGETVEGVRQALWYANQNGCNTHVHVQASPGGTYLHACNGILWAGDSDFCVHRQEARYALSACRKYRKLCPAGPRYLGWWAGDYCQWQAGSCARWGIYW